MPSMTEYGGNTSAKLLITGESGSGKTSSLASIVKAGYELFIADCDNGLAVLKEYLTEEELAKVKFLPFRDPADAKPKAWQQLRDTLITKGWVDGEENYGKVTSWGPERVLVLDTMTFAGRYAMNFTLANNSRAVDAQPSPGEWGDAARALENLTAHITGEHIKCNVVILTHVRYLEDDSSGVVSGFPNSVGSKLSQAIPRYFNDWFFIKRNRDGVPMLRTIPNGQMMLKGSRPKLLKPEMPADLGAILRAYEAK